MSEFPVPIKGGLPAVVPGEIAFPVTELQLVLRACDAGKPLKVGDNRRADLTALRHSASIGPLRRRLAMQLNDDEYHHLLLCGHRGSGKSTELRTLQQGANAEGFLAVHTEVNEQYGDTDLDYSDLFLLAAVVAEQAMADIGQPLPKELIRRVIQWFSDITQEDKEERKSEIGTEVGGQLGGTLPLSLGSLFAKLTASFKGSTTHARTTRETLRRYPDTLIDFTNELLKAANQTLAAAGKPHGLLLIFDNLDRYKPEDVDNILVRSSQQMRQMACHALYTFPISLAYKPITGRIGAEYGLQVVLPMLGLRARSATWGTTVDGTVFDEKGVALLRQALGKRVVIERLFADPNDADLLIKMSGGAIRDLIHLVASAATFTEDERQITHEAVLSAIKELRGTYMRFLTTTPQDYRCLAAISKRASVATQPNDFSEQLNRLLFNGCLLEYMENGDIWHDVHPVLVETKEFRDACFAHDNPRKSA